MIRNTFFLLGIFGLLASAAHSQTGTAKKDAGEVEITFANGSVVRMALLPDEIEITTEFGKLSVPVRAIRRIEFGLHLPEGMDKKVGSAIKRLGSTDYKEREGAMRELVDLGPYAYPFLLQAAKASDPETVRRQDALTKIKAKVPAKDLRIGEEDRVVTPRFTILGRITTKSIKAKSEYFGDVEHSLTKLRHLRAIVDTRESEVVVDAAKFALANQWLDTGITVESYSTLAIAASGEVELRPSMPGNYICGPRGYSSARAGGGGAFPAGGGFGKKKGGAAPADPFTARTYPGTLLGRIGPNGDTFVIGERFEGAIEREGKLFLQIVPSTYEDNATGVYAVKVGLRD